MSETQKDLFEQPRHAADADVAWLENLLRTGTCWMTAGDILISLNRPANDAGKRWLRELASRSGFILAGQRGYRHLEHCSPEEVHHCAAWLESQAKLMGERAGRLRANAHKLFG